MSVSTASSVANPPLPRCGDLQHHFVLDIVNYSSQSVQLRLEWKRRFNRYLEQALSDVPEPERVILDTGDGTAICFLGGPDGPKLKSRLVFPFRGFPVHSECAGGRAG